MQKSKLSKALMQIATALTQLSIDIVEGKYDDEFLETVEVKEPQALLESKKCNQTTEDLKVEAKVEFLRDIPKRFKVKNKEELILQKGSISYRKNEKRYCGRYRDENGKQKCVYAKTKYECALKLKEALANLEKKDNQKGGQVMKNMLLKDWIYYWFENYKFPQVSKTTKYLYKNTWGRLNELKDFGSLVLNKVNRVDVINILGEILNNYPSIADIALRIFQQSFDVAVNDGLIKNNFTKNIILDKVESKKQNTEALTHEQENKILEYFKDNFSKETLYLEFLLSTGMRRGEALALTWADIDCTKKNININKSLNVFFGETGKTKTESGKRIIPLFPKTAEILEQLKLNNWTDSSDLSNKVFEISFNKLRYFMEKLNSTLELSIRIHNFRHTFATRCFEAGIPDKIVQVWLGHKSISTTWDVYTSTTEELINESIKKLTHNN